MYLSKIFLDDFLKYYNDYYGNLKDLRVLKDINLAVRKYFYELDYVFSDENIKSILSFSEYETDIIRTKFGFYSDGEIQSPQSMNKKFGFDKRKSTLVAERFRKVIFNDLNFKIFELLVSLERPGEESVTLLVKKSNGKINIDACNLLIKHGFTTIQDIIKHSKSYVLHVGVSDEIVKQLLLLGYTFGEKNSAGLQI